MGRRGRAPAGGYGIFVGPASTGEARRTPRSGTRARRPLSLPPEQVVLREDGDPDDTPGCLVALRAVAAAAREAAEIAAALEAAGALEAEAAATEEKEDDDDIDWAAAAQSSDDGDGGAGEIIDLAVSDED